MNKQEFYNYLGNKNSLSGYQKSYKLIFLLSFFDNMNSSGKAVFSKVVEDFRLFYFLRKKNNEEVEIKADYRILNIQNSDFNDVWNVIKANPFHVLHAKRVIDLTYLNNKPQCFILNSKLFSELTDRDIIKIKEIICKKINLYYISLDKSNEKENNSFVKRSSFMGNSNAEQLLNQFLSECMTSEEKARKEYNSAIDIEDTEQSIKVADDARRKIKKIKEWKDTVTSLKKDIEESDVFDTHEVNDTVLKQEEKVVEKHDEVYITPVIEEQNPEEYIEPDEKIGEYVRNKMKLLSEAGYYFLESEIELFTSKRWSHRVLGLNYPFMRLYKSNVDVSEQMKDDNGYNRFWKQIFLFKNIKFLISSQWYLHNKEKFDNWYNSFDKQSRIMGKADIKPAEDKEITPPKEIKNYYQPEKYTGEEPVSIELFDRKYYVNHWNELYVKVLEVLLLKKPYVIAKLDKNEDFNSDARINFSYNSADIKYNKKRLSNSLYIETNKSAKDIISTCEKLLKLCGFSRESIKIVYSKEKQYV